MVRDGGWSSTLANGASAIFGEYSVLADMDSSKAFMKMANDIHLHYQSQYQITPNLSPGGPGAFDCELWVGDYFDNVGVIGQIEPNPGTLRGLAQGIFNGSVPTPSIRTNLTLNNGMWPGYGRNTA